MEVQSLSVCVPGGCPNRCKFCVSQMRADEYPNQIEKNTRFRDLYKKDFKNRLMFARDNGCNTCVVTGQGEPLSNPKFLEDFFEWNSSLPTPFRWIELQTSGVGLNDEKMRWLRNAGVCTISLSLSALEDYWNVEYGGIPQKKRFNMQELCNEIKRYNFNLRISLNMTDMFHGFPQDMTSEQFRNNVTDFFEGLRMLGANQLTLRVLYESGDPEIPQNKWIKEHRAHPDYIDCLHQYIRNRGRQLERLPFGAYRYSVGGMSTVIDDDCMSEAGETRHIRYLILRPDCKLYSKWDDKGSLVF